MRHELLVEVRNCARGECHCPRSSVTDLNRETMVNEVEIDLKHALAERNH